MRYGRIVLISPIYSQPDADTIPTGIAYIAEALRQSGIEYLIVDMNLGYSWDDLKRKIIEFSPDLIGISAMTYRYKDHYRLAHSLKEVFPEVAIAIGGPHISFLREKVLQDCSAIDYGFVMDSEMSFVAFCQGVVLSDIPGLIYRSNHKQIIFTGEPLLVTDLDKIPFPTYEGFELNKYTNKVMNILTSRGCPFNCIYCGHHLVGGKKVRVRSVHHVIDEIEYWVERGQKKFNILDSNFSLLLGRVYEFCNELQARNLDIEIWSGTGLRADRLNRRLLKRMKDAGFSKISIGVEGGNDRILKNLKKGVGMKTIEQSISNACELGFDITLFFVVGSPGETITDIEDSAALALRYPVSEVFFHNLIPYPGTELYTWVKAYARFLKDPDEYLNTTTHVTQLPVFETAEFSEAERIKALAYLKKVEKKVWRKSISKKTARFGSFIQGITLMLLSFYMMNKFQNIKHKIPSMRSLAHFVSNRLGL